MECGSGTSGGMAGSVGVPLVGVLAVSCHPTSPIDTNAYMCSLILWLGFCFCLELIEGAWISVCLLGLCYLEQREFSKGLK